MSIQTDWLKLDNLIKEGIGAIKQNPEWPPDVLMTLDRLGRIFREMDLVVNEKGPRYVPPIPTRYSPYR